ncbi:MAG: hypothetical protein U0905_02210 [Pirellulales bacterium]
MKTTPFNELDDQAILGLDQVPYTSLEPQQEDFQVLVEELRDSFSRYLRKRPLVATGVVFLTGFYIGWKVKPW